MATATAHDLVRVIRTARPLFVQLARMTGCTCINGVGITIKRTKGKKTDQPAIVFYVSQKLSLRNLPVHNRIPKQINIPWEDAKDGVLEVLTDVQAVQFQAFRNVTRERPCPGGFSIGHPDVSAGTLGCLVKHTPSGDTMILSNNHVLANTNEASIGDPIIQPGDADGGTVTNDVIAKLAAYHEIEFATGASNLIDAAIAKPINPDDVVHKIHDIGDTIPIETRDITVDDLGEPIKKSGRTTQFTSGYVETVNFTGLVKYGLFQKANFVDQIVISNPLPGDDISAGGDSGSAVLDENNKLIGLLFAGSDRNEEAGEPATAIVNKIKHVFSIMNLETLP